MTAKHRAIHDELLGRILSGTWAPGAAIPNEVDLAREFEVTRPTVARALGELVKEGLIERRRRAGSRVAERQSREAVLSIPLVRREIEDEGRVYAYRLIEREMLAKPGPLVRALIGPGAALRVKCLHTAEGAPWQFEDRLINLATVPAAERQDFRDRGPNEWLVDAIPFSRATQALSAEPASAEEARRLGIAEGAPVFVVTRRTWLGDDPVTQARLVHPGASYRLIARDRGPG
ncbi:UTRA domain-containing protein [Amaricoccus sp. W119]|uniref:UTRA domain-containing protein n=1 Tax=Amaricoccus sp. W119 TaxID=3391833 RepID=UPI0039A66F17